MMDPVDLSIYWNRLVSISEEGASTIARAAFSRIVSEACDYSCVVCDVDGDLIAHPLQSLPEFVGSLWQVVRHAPDERAEPIPLHFVVRTIFAQPDHSSAMNHLNDVVRF